MAQGEIPEAGVLRDGRLRARGAVRHAKLRLARREGDALIYVGRVGTGWDRKTAAALRRTLAPLACTACPLAKKIKRADTIWVEPRYEADVAYSEITSDGMVRHPSFKGLGDPSA